MRSISYCLDQIKHTQCRDLTNLTSVKMILNHLSSDFGHVGTRNESFFLFFCEIRNKNLCVWVEKGLLIYNVQYSRRDGSKNSIFIVGHL